MAVGKNGRAAFLLKVDLTIILEQKKVTEKMW